MKNLIWAALQGERGWAPPNPQGPLLLGPTSLISLLNCRATGSCPASFVMRKLPPTAWHTHGAPTSPGPERGSQLKTMRQAPRSSAELIAVVPSSLEDTSCVPSMWTARTAIWCLRMQQCSRKRARSQTRTEPSSEPVAHKPPLMLMQLTGCSCRKMVMSPPRMQSHR